MKNSILNKIDVKSLDNKEKQTSRVEKISAKDVAVIGIALRFPMASDMECYWKNLAEGIDCISEFPLERREFTDDYLSAKGMEINYQKSGYLKDVSSFDCGYFNIPPGVANLMDPHQRIYLETVCEAVEDAGYGDGRLKGSRTGVYTGYRNDEIIDYKSVVKDLGYDTDASAIPGNLTSILASRISYSFDLKGPSMCIDTSCSSAFVGIHLACQGMRNGDCDMAIAGAINLKLFPLSNDNILGIETSDGRVKAFDDTADGSIWGEGASAILLKPLNKALSDHDQIYAVIKGSAINQDGTSVSITAPNAASQSDVLVRAWKNAGINPEDLTYIEAHGTGTNLGDPVEIDGIEGAFSQFTNKKHFCAISSVKTNLGHLESVAGMAGLIKAIQALRHRELPPSLNFNIPNRKVDFINSPLYVNTKRRIWEDNGKPLLCGINVFGMSGTNSHIVLQEAPVIASNRVKNIEVSEMLLLSAKSKQLLVKIADNLLKYVEEYRIIPLADICFSANVGRSNHNHRVAFTFKTRDELIRKLIEIRDQVGLSEDRVDCTYYINIVNPEENSRIDKTDSVTHHINQYLKNKDSEDLEQLCKLYTEGAEIRCKEFYIHRGCNRVNLPAYPFERKTCWVGGKYSYRTPMEQTLNNYYYNMKWIEAENQSDHQNQQIKQEVVLVIYRETERNSQVISLLEKNCKKIILAELRGKNERVNDNHFILDGSLIQWGSLFHEKEFETLSRILFLGTEEQDSVELSIDNIDQLQQSGVIQLYRILKGLEKNGLLGKEIQLIFASLCINQITGNELELNPYGATVYGMGQVIQKENETISCKFVDYDIETPLTTIIREILSEDKEYAIGYRSNTRYRKEYDKAEILQEQRDFPLSEQGIYIITGGLGGIGLALAEYLTKDKDIKMNIALLSRSGLPDKETWAELLNQSGDQNIIQKIRAVQKIEENGATVECRRVDISDWEAMSTLHEDLRLKYGRINGIIHCAGTGSGGLIIEKSEQDFINTLTPKVKGTWILDQLTRVDQPDFFIMCSSISTIFPNMYFGDYIAANAFMDSYSAYRNKAGFNTLTINWTTWKETGMAAARGIVMDTIFKTLTTSEAVEAFDTIIRQKLSTVVIGQLNTENGGLALLGKSGIRLSSQLQTSIDRTKAKGKMVRVFNRAIDENVKLSGGGIKGNYTEIQKELSKIWGNHLGVQEISLNDNLYEYGGDSIIGLKIARDIADKMGYSITMVDILQNPTIYKLAEHIENIDKNLELQTVHETYMEPKKAENKPYYSLSSNQNRIYSIDKLDQTKRSNNQSRVVRITGKLEIDKMKRIVQQIIDRHEALRTSFQIIDHEVKQVIEENVSIEIGIINAEERNVEELISNSICPFDLTKAPLMRLTIIELKQDHYLLVIDKHHIITDGVSIDQFLNEFKALENNEELEPVKYQYRDFSEWQIQQMESETMKKQEDYWLEVLKPPLPLLKLPTDFERPKVKTYRGKTLKRHRERNFIDNLSNFDTTYNVTQYITLLSALFVLLHKYTAQNDIIIGTPITGRSQSCFDRTMGMFVNTLAMRNYPNQNISFLEFLEQVKETSLKAFNNQDYQFDALVRKLDLKSDLSRNQLFDVYFALQNIGSKSEIKSIGYHISQYDYDKGISRFDLALDVTEKQDYIEFMLEYSTDLFEQESIEYFIMDYFCVLDKIFENPYIKIGDIVLHSLGQWKTSADIVAVTEDIEFNF